MWSASLHRSWAALACACAVGGLLLLLGLATPASIGLSTGLCALTVRWWVEDPGERTQNLHLLQATSGARWSAAAWWLFCAAVATALLFAAPDPRLELMQLLQQVVRVVGLLALFVQPLQTLVSEVIADDLSPSRLRPVISRAMHALLAYAAAVWAIGSYGDAGYVWLEGDPQRAGCVVIAALVIRWILRVGSVPYETAKPPPVGRGVLRAEPEAPLSERDLIYCSAHEAGHAITLAALGGLPEGVAVHVNRVQDTSGVLGAVTGVSTKHLLQEKAFNEWAMVLLLAGKAAEVRLVGTSTSGTSEDHASWLYRAKGYLANFAHGIFYLRPDSEAEVLRNEQHLIDLQAEQLRLVYRLFDTNMPVLEGMWQALRDSGTLTREELLHHLAKVHVPDGFPRPRGDTGAFNFDPISL